MEKPSFSSPETKGSPAFNEYSSGPIYVLEDVSGLDPSTQAMYKSADLGDRNVFVRIDILTEIEESTAKLNPYEFKSLLHELLPEIPPTVHRVLRPVFRRSYELRDKKKSDELTRYREEAKIQRIQNKESEDKKRIEVVQFIESFPLDIKERLERGVFLIDSEGRYYPSVEEGQKSFLVADKNEEYESRKAGNWERGLLETLKAGSPYVKSFLPSTMSGVINSFRAELKDGTVTAVVAGNNLSTFGDNDLSCRVLFNDGESEKEIFKSFKPF